MQAYLRPVRARLGRVNEAGLAYGHVHLNVTDIELHKKLWVEQFGGVLVQRVPLTVVRLPELLMAFNAREPTGDSQGTVMYHVGFKVRNLAVFLAKWRSQAHS